MTRIFILACIFAGAGGAFAQNLSDIFNNVDTVGLDGFPGEFQISGNNVTPIISTNCSFNLQHYAVAAEHGNGKVVAIGHEGLMGDATIVEYDNLNFILNAINWMDGGTGTTISLKTGWVNLGNTTILQSELQNVGYTTSAIANLNSTSLSNTDILILGNDWNGNAPYSASEISAIESFVSNGGSLFIAGLGWSWPGTIGDYPMNAVANQFGFSYSTSGINENPFINFYPDNLNATSCPSPYFGHNITRGDSLTIIRLAVSCTGEFTQSNGGVAATEVLIDNWIESINEVYGREYCMRFEIVPNNTDIVFPDPNTDPWDNMPPSVGCNNSGIIMADQEQAIDSIIGASNYDISHVILSTSQLGGGCAGAYKAGISGGLDIPVTRHEMGHQFGQAHTINNGGSNNYETANGGWTIQGGNGQGRAHAVSYHQLALNLINNAPIGTNIATGNAIPTIDAGADVTIPHSTPFVLTAIASDADVDDSLTYVWDNMDRGFEQFFPVADDSQGAIFMRIFPTDTNGRIFPTMPHVIANDIIGTTEQLPTQARSMHIRATVNDNKQILYNGQMVNASAISSDDIKITVSDVGPFEVTSQSTSGIVYSGGTTQLVTWAVNGTDVAPISTSQVKISLSVDGGYTYPYVLLTSTANDGSEPVTLPNITTSTARIKVEAVGNIYFDLNFENFSIIESVAGIQSEENRFKVYPNPVNQILYISTSDENSNYTMSLYDLSGRLVETEFNAKSINLNHLTNGVYTLKIEHHDSGAYHLEKVIISH